MTYHNVVAEKKSFLYLLKRKKYHVAIVGLAVACLHFVVTSIINLFVENYFTESLIFLLLIAPSISFAFILLSLNPALVLFDNISTIQPLFILLSSALYGVIAGLLATKRTIFQLIGAVIIGLIILSSCLLANMWTAASW